MRSLIWVFAGRTSLIVGFVVCWLITFCYCHLSHCSLESWFYRLYSKIWDTLTPSHICPIICKSLFHYLLICLKILLDDWQTVYTLDAAEYDIWSGSTLFARACLPQYLGLLWYRQRFPLTNSTQSFWKRISHLCFCTHQLLPKMCPLWFKKRNDKQYRSWWDGLLSGSTLFAKVSLLWMLTQLAFYVNLHRAVIGPSATLTGRWRPDIDLRRMLTGYVSAGLKGSMI